ncbi:MAG: hypothetical protein RIG62_04355 [Cyclobacteriaceae bacterium]
MKAIKVLSQPPAFFMLMLLLLIIAVVGPAISQPGYGDNRPGNPSGQYPSSNPQYPSSMPENSVAGQGQKVVIYDKGLQMPMGSYIVPAGWQIVQDVATNPSTGQPMSQKMDIVGPQGELLRSLGMAQYAPMMGTDFEQSWRQMVMAGLQGELNQPNLGRPTPSVRMQRNQMLQQYAQTVASQGFKLECLEAPISGNRNGQPYQGMVSIVHLTPANMPNMGTIQVSLTISPANQLAQALMVSEQVGNSFQPNPQYQQRLQQIQQKAMGAYGNEGNYNANDNQNRHTEYLNQIRQQSPNEYPARYQQIEPDYSNTQEGYYPTPDASLDPNAMPDE